MQTGTHWFLILSYKPSSFLAKQNLYYAMLLKYAWGNKDSVFPGQERLAEDCGTSARTVWTAIKELEKNGFVTIIRRGLGKTNLYILHLRKVDTVENAPDSQ